MAGVPITVGGLEAATNTDILQGTRLQTVASAGIMTFEVQAADAVAANGYTITIQLPNGDTPMNGVPVPGNAGTAGVAGVIDSRTNIKATYPIDQGGHVGFSCVETGDTELAWRVTFTPF
jgi:hypothetical protein